VESRRRARYGVRAAADAISVLQPYPAELMQRAPASMLVNSARNDGPELLEAAA
jgi:putative SOS response-associated peptidase YedK